MYNICEKTTEIVKTHLNLNDILTLMQRVLWGQADQADKDAAEGLRQDPEIKRICNELTNYDYLKNRLDQYDKFDPAIRFNKFKKQVGDKQYSRQIAYRIVKYAAVFLLPLTIGITYWFIKDTSPLAVSPSQSIAYGLPGKSSATLRLASGEVIDVSDHNLNIQGQQVLVTTANDSTVYAVTQPTSWNELTIPRGGEYRLTLDDGTTVWLNSDSKLKFPVSFSNTSREVYAEGEVYFKVKHESARSFIVHTQTGSVNVLGTSFAIRSYQDNAPTFITLVEGRVSFKSADSQRQIKIIPGQQVAADLSGNIQVNTVDVQEWVAWKDGLFVFKDRSLRYIMDELARWYDVRTEFEDSSLEKLSFTGVLSRYEKINSFLEILEGTQDIRYRYEAGKIIIFK